jgi:hypothetical protein
MGQITFTGKNSIIEDHFGVIKVKVCVTRLKLYDKILVKPLFIRESFNFLNASNNYNEYSNKKSKMDVLIVK